MIKKRVGIIFLTVAIIIATFALAGCKDDGDWSDGNDGAIDPYGREFNNAYDIDEYLTGIYSVSYEIQASAMGKSMLKSNCSDRVSVSKTEDGLVLTYYCKNDSFTDIRLKGVEATTSDKNGMRGYAFDVERQDLDESLQMSGYVDIMKMNVEFKITLNLNDAILIG